MKRILINLFHFTPKSQTGVFVYADNLVRELVRINTGHTYWLVVHRDMYEHLKKILSNNVNVRYIVFGKFSLFFPKIVLRLFKKRDVFEDALRRRLQTVIDKERIGAVFFPSGAIMPKGLNNIKIVTTLYDLQHEYFPENFSPKHLERRREDNSYAARNADHILAISEFTKRTLIEKYGIREEKITVTHLASQEFKQAEAVPLPKQYLFYPAAIWSHKNHHILFAAFDMLKNKFPELNLVLTGIEKNRDILKNIPPETIYLGHVSGNILRTIYENAAALVFPSGFEGFGIPVVEAFSLGVPVVAADNTSIPEVTGDAGILVPTDDAKAFADAIERVLIDRKLRSELIAKGRERAKLFSWKGTARRTSEVFNRV